MPERLTTLQDTDLRINGEEFPYTKGEFDGSTLVIDVAGDVMHERNVSDATEFRYDTLKQTITGSIVGVNVGFALNEGERFYTRYRFSLDASSVTYDESGGTR